MPICFSAVLLNSTTLTSTWTTPPLLTVEASASMPSLPSAMAAGFCSCMCDSTLSVLPCSRPWLSCWVNTSPFAPASAAPCTALCTRTCRRCGSVCLRCQSSNVVVPGALPTSSAWRWPRSITISATPGSAMATRSRSPGRVQGRCSRACSTRSSAATLVAGASSTSSRASQRWRGDGRGQWRRSVMDALDAVIGNHGERSRHRG